MNIGFTGSRSIQTYDFISRTLTPYIVKWRNLSLPVKFITGGAKGVDKNVEIFAKIWKIENDIYHPDWNGLGRKAGILRNFKILDNSDYIIAYWDGESKGTLHCLENAKKRNKLALLFTCSVENGLVVNYRLDNYKEL
jgi:hypothetical protein